MKFSISICALLMLLMFSEVTSQTVSCEEIEDESWAAAVKGSLKTCSMRSTTTIHSDEFDISPADFSVQALYFNNNRNILFLPFRVQETFPNLTLYSVGHCSLKELSKKNFKNLNKLSHLYFDDNKIERINKGTFEDLTSLEVLWLNHNQIKKINGALFRGLTRLTTVRLEANVCIDKDFTTATEIATMSRVVDDHCGFAEVEHSLENFEKLQDEIVSLKAETKASMSMMSQLAATLGEQWNLTCIEKTKELTETVKSKLGEISGLLDDQATSRATIKEKTSEIAWLKERLETLGSN